MVSTVPRPTRQHARYPVRVSCELTIAGQTHHAETKNLSPGGAAISLRHPLRVGEVVTVSLFLTEDGIEDPDQPSFECAASIRWSNEVGERRYETGLQFISPSEQQRTVLSEFLERTS